MNEKKTSEGKNGLRSYTFEKVQKLKVIKHYEPGLGMWTEEYQGMFYTKHCLYCSQEFEARRVDTAFCSQGCQKAHLRLRRRNS